MNLIKKYWIGFFLLSLLIVASILIYIKINPKKLPPNLIEGVGRIDGDIININTKYPGRVKDIFIEDGQKIKKSFLIATIYSKEYEAKHEAIEATIEAKKSELKAKEIELNITKSLLPENVKQALYNKEAKEQMLKELQKSIKTQKEIVLQDERDFKRLKNLFQQNLIQKQKLEQIKLKLIADKNALLALLHKEKEAKSAIKAANSILNQAKSSLLKIQILQYAIKGLKNGIEALNAQKKEIETIINELKIYSPIDGYILEKIAQKGEVLGAGMSIATAIDPKSLYLKIFIDTINNGKIKIGDKAVIFLDAYPNRPIKAKVVRIAQKAEFTPKEVAVRSDRIERVYAVHLKPIKPNSLLKVGLPAIGVVSIDGKNLPKSLNELPKL